MRCFYCNFFCRNSLVNLPLFRRCSFVLNFVFKDSYAPKDIFFNYYELMKEVELTTTYSVFLSRVYKNFFGIDMI